MPTGAAYNEPASRCQQAPHHPLKPSLDAQDMNKTKFKGQFKCMTTRVPNMTDVDSPLMRGDKDSRTRTSPTPTHAHARMRTHPRPSARRVFTGGGAALPALSDLLYTGLLACASGEGSVEQVAALKGLQPLPEGGCAGFSVPLHTSRSLSGGLHLLHASASGSLVVVC